MVQKTKLNSNQRTKFGAESKEEFEEFLQNLLSVDFNSRGLDK